MPIKKIIIIFHAHVAAVTKNDSSQDVYIIKGSFR